MSRDALLAALRQAAADPDAPLPDSALAGDEAPLAALAVEQIKKNRALAKSGDRAADYIRAKVNQLLEVIGTVPLRSEELDDEMLITLDPIGVIADSFVQILDNLQETNQRLELAMDEVRAVFESVGGALVVLDHTKRIRAANRRFRELFAVGEDPVGRFCHEVIDHTYCPEQQCPFAAMLANGAPTGLDEVAIGEGIYNIRVTPVKDSAGRVVSGVLLFFDVTEQKAARTALAAEKERLAVTLRSIGEGMLSLDLEGRIVLMNSVAEELTGWSQPEATGKPSCDVFWIAEEKRRQRCINMTSEILRRGEAVERSDDTVLIGRDGTERLVWVSGSPIKDDEGEVMGVVIVFRDITTEKKLEAELLNARRIESLALLAGGIAHDFNNLLTGILGNITLAKISAPAGSPQHEKLGRAESASLRARDLTQQLLTFSKGGTPVKKTAHIAELIRETTLFGLRGSNVECAFRIDEGLWPVEVDEGQIGQVISNLVINACQAMPHGGAITVHADNVTLGRRKGLPLAKGRYVRITITDRGVGIPPEHLDRIFDPYFTTKQGGSGLGLASSYAIVKKHGGHITVESDPGQGTQFTIYLAASAARPEAKPEFEPQPQALSGGRILVMDDEELIRELASEILGHHGFEVDSACHGNEALAMYEKAMQNGRPYDLVVMDLTIPGGMGGRETIRRLRQLDPGVRAIVSSGYSMDAAMADYRRHGFIGVVPKPYKQETLLQAICGALTENRDPAGDDPSLSPTT